MRHDLWSLRLLSDQRIDPAAGAQIMRTLLTVLPEFRPVRYGVVDPDAGRWTDDLLERFESVWPVLPGLSFAFAGADGTWGSLASIAGNHIHSSLHLHAPGAGPDDHRALRFLAAVADHAGGEFGLIHRIHRLDMLEARRAAGNRTLIGRRSDPFLSVTSHNLKRGIPDIYWATLFGRRYVDMLGQQRLQTAPAAKVELFSGGYALVQATARSADVVALAAAAPFRAARERIIEHLGRDAFYHPQRPDGTTVIPAFDDTIARSLRSMDPADVEARRRLGIE